MDAKAKAVGLRVPATKVRRVIALVRGKKAADALTILKFTPNKGARYA